MNKRRMEILEMQEKTFLANDPMRMHPPTPLEVRIDYKWLKEEFLKRDVLSSELLKAIEEIESEDRKEE